MLVLMTFSLTKFMLGFYRSCTPQLLYPSTTLRELLSKARFEEARLHDVAQVEETSGWTEPGGDWRINTKPLSVKSSQHTLKQMWGGQFKQRPSASKSNRRVMERDILLVIAP